MSAANKRQADLQTQFSDLCANIKLEMTSDLMEEVKKHEATAAAFAVAPPIPVVNSSSSSSDRNTPWIANRILLKGWCACGSNGDALYSEKAEAIGTSVVAKLPLHLSSKIDKVSAPYFKNRQITLHLKDNLANNDPWDICTAIRSAITSNNLHVAGKPLIASLDAPPWKRERNSILASASGAVLRETGLTDAELQLDWPSGSLYAKASATVPRDTSLGQVVRAQWVWHDMCVRAALPRIDLATLKMSLENE